MPLGRTTRVPVLSSVTSERAPLLSTTSSISASEQTWMRGIFLPFGAALRQRGRRAVEFGEALEEARLRLGRPERQEIRGEGRQRKLGRAEDRARLGEREAGERGRLEIGGGAVGRFDRLGDVGRRPRGQAVAQEDRPEQPV